MLSSSSMTMLRSVARLLRQFGYASLLFPSAEAFANHGDFDRAGVVRPAQIFGLLGLAPLSNGVRIHIGRPPGADVGSKACDPSSEWITQRQIRYGKSQALLATQNNFLAHFDNPIARYLGVRMLCVPRNPLIEER
jgi:hypothetical protein